VDSDSTKDHTPIRAHRSGSRHGRWVLGGRITLGRPVEGLPHLIHLVLVLAVGKGGTVFDKSLHPRRDRRMGKIDVAGIHLWGEANPDLKSLYPVSYGTRWTADSGTALADRT
jgi:hypothetical protein